MLWRCYWNYCIQKKRVNLQLLAGKILDDVANLLDIDKKNGVVFGNFIDTVTTNITVIINKKLTILLLVIVYYCVKILYI